VFPFRNPTKGSYQGFKTFISISKGQKHLVLAFKFVTIPHKPKTIDYVVKPSWFWFVRTLTNSSRSSESTYKIRGNQEEKGGRK